MTSLCVPGDSEGDEEETTQDEVSSHTSEEDGGVVKVEKELETADAPVGSGDALVEHEASALALGQPAGSLPPPQPAPSTGELLSGASLSRGCFQVKSESQAVLWSQLPNTLYPEDSCQEHVEGNLVLSLQSPMSSGQKALKIEEI